MVSIIIPARNEVYLERTIRNILENAEGEIEVIVILDGYKPDPQIDVSDDRVIFHHFEESIGQRAAVNYGAKQAKGKYIMKLDAHCAVDKGFDIKLAKDCEYDWTVIPRMYNLDSETWKPKLHKRTDYMYFTSPQDEKPFRAAYYGSKQPKNNLMIDDVMCNMGPGWFMHKDRFWELGGMDEEHGGWGQMGIEVSLKAWLSGGSLKVNKNTWFAHWFRGGGGPGFPYKISGREVDKARKHSKDLWLNDKWPLAKRKLQWVIDKFNPPGWKKPNLTILYYTANVVAEKISSAVIRSLKKHGYPIISISQKPMNLGTNIVVPEHRSVQNIYRQILVGAKAATTEYVALCEDDCLYLPEHFTHRPEKAPFTYNINRWNFHLLEGVYSYRNRPVLSQCIANREALIKNLEERVGLPKLYDKDCGEFGLYEKQLGITECEYETFSTTQPNMVICHVKNISGRKYIGKDADPITELEPWGKAEYWLTKFKDGRPKGYRLWSHIGSKIFDMEELWGNRLEYVDPRPGKANSILDFIVVGRKFFEDIHSGKTFTDKELAQHPYYAYQLKKLNPADKDPLTEKGKRHTLKVLKDGINLYHDIKKNGMCNPIDMIKMGGKLFIHRGGRRLEILKLLGYKKVPCRIFNSREMFIAHMPDKDVTPDNSIHGLAMQQFMKLKEKATDKFWVHSYTKHYDMHFTNLRNEPLKLLEIGVLRGASLLLWKAAFPKAQIFGLDKDEKWHEMLDGTDIKVFVGRQEDQEFLKKQVLSVQPYDIIIDDGGHYPLQQQASFKTLWDSLKPGGWYVIEDLYGNYRPERIKHTTMTMLKNMLDEMNLKGTIKAMYFYYNICFIHKGQG